MNLEDDGLWNTEKAAHYLSKTPYWLRTNRHKLNIPHYQLGSHIRFKKQDLDTWLDNNKGGTLK
jgi:excisionase family DNA binding protein